MGIGPTFIYIFAIILVFGWYVYLPFILLHILLLRKLNRPSWAASVLVGSALAAVLAIVLIGTPFLIITGFPQFSTSRVHDVFSFTIGGGFYGLIYWKWLAVNVHSSKN
ncbi:hypothetical protein BEN47_05615 [Hymenobacter lapidarius]|uniref:Uncharacterized protein n=1 Tax=Hymenobacter lapidarius TaxID=1908237 RepID=A0A1G1SS21_9BACT|nr:hypothetical protein BEN47_05615 [Hymenobacter lapidarius]